MKLNVLLNNIDGLFDEDLIEKVELYFEQYDILALKEVDKNLWSCRFDIDAEPCETEIQLAGQKVKEAACDCQWGMSGALCWHTAVALIGIRDRISSAKAEKIIERQAKIKSNKATKLTVAHIIKQVPEEALRAFLIEQARSNKDLSLALKMHFLSGLQQTDRIAPYRELVEADLSVQKLARQRQTPKKMQQINNIFSQFNKKCDISLKEADINLYVDLCALVLPAYLRCLRYAPNSKTDRLFTHFHGSFEAFYTLTKAPEVLQKFWNFVQSEWYDNAHQDYAQPLFQWLIGHITEPLQYDVLMEAVHKKLALHKQNKALFYTFLTYKIRLLWAQNQVSVIREVVAQAYSQPLTIYNLIVEYANDKLVDLVEIIAEIGLPLLEEKDEKEYVRHVQFILFELYKNRPDKEAEAVRLAKKLLVNTLQADYYHFLVSKSIDNKSIETLIDKIEKQKFSTQQRDILAEMFFGQGQFAVLCDYAIRLQSLELIRVFAPRLWPHVPTWTLKMCEKVLSDYLMVHLGTAPAQRVRVIIEYYMLVGNLDLAKAVVLFLRQQFQERLSLIKELNEIDA